MWKSAFCCFSTAEAADKKYPGPLFSSPHSFFFLVSFLAVTLPLLFEFLSSFPNNLPSFHVPFLTFSHIFLSVLHSFLSLVSFFPYFLCLVTFNPFYLVSYHFSYCFLPPSFLSLIDTFLPSFTFSFQSLFFSLLHLLFFFYLPLSFLV